MFQDLVLFLGLLGFVCSIGMRVSMRGMSGNAINDRVPAAGDADAPGACLDVSARSAIPPERSACRRQ